MDKLKKLLNNEKDIIIVKNTIAAFIIKGSALIVSIFSLPIYIRYFDNQEILGVWFTILSILIWILSFDFGIGNGLRNKLVVSIINKDSDEIRTVISSSYFILGSISGIILFIGVFLIPLINWNTFFNISSELLSQDVIVFVMYFLFTTITLQFFLRIVNFILYALQKSSLNIFIALMTSVSQVIIILLLPSINASVNIKILSIIYLLTVNIPLLGATFYVFKKPLKGLHPSINYFKLRMSKDILQLGGIFFWNQIMYTILIGSNAFLISKLIGPGHVVDYQIYYRVFSLMGILFNLALTPMWSAITKAFEEKDYDWIHKYFVLLLQLTFLVFLIQLLIPLFMQSTTDMWLGVDVIQISYFYSFMFSIFGGVFVLQNVLSTFACGIGELKLQSCFYSIGVLVKICAVYFITRIYSDWIVIVIIDVIVLLPYCTFQALDLKKRLNASNSDNL